MFSGRASRSEYFWFLSFTTFLFIILTSLCLLGSLLFPLTNSFSPFLIAGIGYGLFSLTVALPVLAVTVRRFHDSGWSGWWFGGSIIASMGFLALGGLGFYLKLQYLGWGGLILYAIVGISFTIILYYLIFTGKGATERNQYGAPLSPDTPATAISAFCILTVIGAGTLTGLQIDALEKMSLSAGLASPNDELPSMQSQHEVPESTGTMTTSIASKEGAGEDSEQSIVQNPAPEALQTVTPTLEVTAQAAEQITASVATPASAFVEATTPTVSPSFDCRKAATTIEKQICASPKLSELDAKLTETYQELKQFVDKKELKSEQITWVKTRNRCVDTACLEQSYEERLNVLEDYLIRQKRAIARAFSQ